MTEFIDDKILKDDSIECDCGCTTWEVTPYAMNTNGNMFADLRCTDCGQKRQAHYVISYVE